MKKIFSVMLLAIFPICLFGQNISFFREDLHFTLEKELFEVDGLYYFCNLTDSEVKRMLFYPFPDVEKYGEIAYIRITKENDTVSTLAAQSTNGSMFKITLPPNGEQAYRIRYGQKLISNEARYIITTTQNWERPFEKAIYTCTFPKTLTLDSISIPPDSIKTSPENTTYYWKKVDFMPVVDFIFNFTEK